MLNPDISYFFWIGSLYLLILTYQDFKNKMMVDDRYNFFMFGITASILTHIKRDISYLLIGICLMFAFYWFMRYVKVMGEGDIKSFSWILLGFFYILPQLILSMMTFLIVIMAIEMFVFKLLEKHTNIKNIKKTIPFFHIITSSFILTGIWHGGFGF